MKNAYIRALCLLCTFVLLISALFSCSKNDASDSITAHGTDVSAESETSTDASIGGGSSEPDVDYGGADFTVVCQSGNEASDIFYDASLPSEYDRKIKERNEAVEEAIGVKIKEDARQNVARYVKELTKADASPDLVYASGNGGMSELMLYDCLASLSEYGKHNATAAGVSVSVVQQLSIFEEIYMLTGAPIRSSVESATVVAYDEGALRSIGYEEGYLCSLVLDGDWTLDKMTSLSKQAKVLSTVDTAFKAVSGNQNALFSLWKGLGARTVQKANGDVPTVSVYSPKNVYLFELVNNFADEVEGVPDTAGSLFYIGTVSDARSAYREDFGVLPIPSLNEGGEYTCLLDFSSTFFTEMPVYASNREMTLNFLSRFYSESVGTVYPITTGETCYKNAKVLDIILKSRYFDFFDMYGYGDMVSSVFFSQTDKDDFDALLKDRAEIAKMVLEILFKDKTEDKN